MNGQPHAAPIMGFYTMKRSARSDIIAQQVPLELSAPSPVQGLSGPNPRPHFFLAKKEMGERKSPRVPPYGYPLFASASQGKAAGGAWGVFYFKKVVDKLHNHVTRNTPLHNTSFAQRRGQNVRLAASPALGITELLGSNG